MSREGRIFRGRAAYAQIQFYIDKNLMLAYHTRYEDVKRPCLRTEKTPRIVGGVPSGSRHFYLRGRYEKFQRDIFWGMFQCRLTK